MIEVMRWTGGLEVLMPVFDAWEAEHNGDDFGMAVSRLSVMADIKSLIDNPAADLLVLVDEGAAMGFLGLFKGKNWLNGKTEAVEKYWYVLPENRTCGYMLWHEARKWGADRGCDNLVMSASRLASDMHDKVCRFYENMGMKPFETSYIIKTKV